MNPRYLLDTNICIYIRRRRPPEILQRFLRLQVGEAAISVVTFGELIYGAEKSSQREPAIRQLEELVSLLPVLPLPADAGRSYGALRADLETDGRVIGNNDLWITAHAKAAKLILVTNNEREFQRVSGLEIQNWAKSKGSTSSSPRSLSPSCTHSVLNMSSTTVSVRIDPVIKKRLEKLAKQYLVEPNRSSLLRR